jgi:hypothetical protein
MFGSVVAAGANPLIVITDPSGSEAISVCCSITRYVCYALLQFAIGSAIVTVVVAVQSAFPLAAVATTVYVPGRSGGWC